MSRKRSCVAVSPELALAVQAFGSGFAVGADSRAAMKRHVVEPTTHQHWVRGFIAGRVAAARAERRYAQSAPLAAPDTRGQRRRR